MVMIGGGPAYKGPRKPMMLRALVANSDEVYQRALDAGAVSTLAMTENYGERFGCVRDRFGNQWIISTQIGPSYCGGPGSQHHHVHQSAGRGEIDRFHEAGVRSDGSDEGGRSGGTGETRDRSGSATR